MPFQFVHIIIEELFIRRNYFWPSKSRDEKTKKKQKPIWFSVLDYLSRLIDVIVRGAWLIDRLTAWGECAVPSILMDARRQQGQVVWPLNPTSLPQYFIGAISVHSSNRLPYFSLLASTPKKKIKQKNRHSNILLPAIRCAFPFACLIKYLNANFTNIVWPANSIW